MIDLRSRLQVGDPLARETKLSSADRERMRSRLRSAAIDIAPTQRGRWPAVAAAMLLVGVAAALVVPGPHSPPPAVSPTHVTASDLPLARQLQFSTPGGTRVIWTFNPNFYPR